MVEKFTLDNNDFLKDRVVFMEGNFDDENCNKLKKELLHLFSHDSKKPITIYITSFGGYIHNFLSIYGLLKTAQCKITTIALGQCMSCGAFLLLCGDERLAYPHAQIMLHELSAYQPYSKLHELEIDFKYSKTLQKILNDLVKKTTKIKNVAEFMKEDNFLDLNDALKIGVIHKVIGDKK